MNLCGSPVLEGARIDSPSSQTRKKSQRLTIEEEAERDVISLEFTGGEL